ncbi:MAG: DUF559 domain-containing protein [Pseudomonadota bacterium]|uniref:endonuclease domain-containing protein n=1 Tax=Sphingobium naphthae TaxID=1886786 RepID=UPI002B178BC5|nr:DUF559 domain-containing protein [Pseudomonadota bacterium]
MTDAAPSSVPPPASGRGPGGRPVPHFAPPATARAKSLRHNQIIELDSASHGNNAGHDARLDEYRRTCGFEILRFSNADVMGNLEGVVSHISAVLARLPTPCPSRKREGGK